VAEAEELLVAFGRALRDAGLAAGTDRIAAFCTAASLCPGELYWAGRATLVAGPGHVPVYDRVFSAWFGGVAPAAEIRTRGVLVEEVELAPASRVEVLRTKSFSRCSPDELAEIAALMAKLPLALPPRRTRRRRPARRGAPDLRRTLRRSFRTAGEPLERCRRERVRRPRRLVLLLDVSGSMSDYSRALVLFAHAALRGDRRVEAFCFGTRLTRVTRALAGADASEALRLAAAEVVDWEGGTRIGDALERFLDEYGHAGLARGAVVVICSDGLEVGDPELLREQMERLARLAHRVVWLNPLKEHPAYEPLVRGMRAALPYMDLFVSGHNLASLEALGSELARM
jgi:uncharacterized protein with von Willebrand factor type A (vWA) domain